MINKTQYEKVLSYHQRTKHHPQRFARSLGYMDWDNEPNPFRFYDGTERISLPFIKDDVTAPYTGLYSREKNNAHPLDLAHIGRFLELSLGLSAWKAAAGGQWSLRINPSSGDFHPTECYPLLPLLDDQKGGIFHYNPFLHILEKRAELPGSFRKHLRTHFNTNGFLIALTTISWRESWKYGERAFRYCNLDMGHALAALSFSANIHGWKMIYLNTVSDEDIRQLLGFHRVSWVEEEEEYPEALCFVCPVEGAEVVPGLPRTLPAGIGSVLSNLVFKGVPNRLSQQHQNWKIISETVKYTEKPNTDENSCQFGNRAFLHLNTADSTLSAEAIIRKRRSGVNFDQQKSIIAKEKFLILLDKTLPRQFHAPFDLELNESNIHLLLFVHQVTGLESGLYFFIRNEDHLAELQHSTSSQFSWEIVAPGFPLYLLKRGNYRQAAMFTGCEQEIAGNSAFSVGMIARFEPVIKREPYRYRHLGKEEKMTGILFRCLFFIFLVPSMVFPAEIHQLCREGKSQQVLSLLKGLDMIHLKDRDGNTPLHIAVMFGHLELTRLLIDYGANVNERNNIYSTPLHMTRNVGIVRELIDNGAEIDAVDHEKITPLHLACRSGDIETAALLIHHCANVNFQNKKGLTPLHFAVDRYFTITWCSPAKLEIARHLIENGAEVNIKDNKNNTPLDYAAMYCNKDLAVLLMGNGAVKREIREENGIVQLTFLDIPQLIQKVKPVYPNTNIHLMGIVILRIVVNKQGLVEYVKVVSGHPLLRHAAINAVKKWVYEPKVIDGEPGKVEFPVFIRIGE